MTNPEEWSSFGGYNRQDVVSEMAIKAKLDSDKYPIPEREWHMYAIDQRINDRGVQIDTHFAKQALALAERRKPAIIAQMKRITGCANPGSTPQLLPWLQANGYPFQDLRADTVKKVIREAGHNGIEPIAVDVLRMRQNSNKSSLAKYQTMLDAAGEDGRFRFSLQFHGASRTGRWAGRRIQTQNLPRTPKALEDVVPLGWANEMIRAGDLSGLDLLNGEPMDTLTGCIRSAFVPGEGKKFVVCDLSSIESVVIGWITNCKWFMDTLKSGKDLYRAFAGEWLNLPYEETKSHRSKAKPATLGCLAPSVEVLTNRGWVPIVDVADDDLLWDGEEWVAHGGVQYMGDKETMDFNGVECTPDHKFFDGENWHEAESADVGSVFGWASRHLPD